MLRKVSTILGTIVEVDPNSMTLNHNLIDDLNLNSLDIINLVVRFEQEFNLEIPDRHVMKFVTIGDIVNYLQERGVTC